MSSEQYSDSLLQAMSIIANRAVSNANFNKTIQAVIVECKDATIEKYRVRYQDGFWEAYGNGSGVTYLPGTSVYILVPNGDMTQPKTIIGTVEKLGINYINTISEQDQYYQTGNNTLNNLQQLQLCSYQTKTIEIYKKDGEENLININEQDTAFYLQSSSHLKCSFNIKTSLDLYQRYGGNYGLKFYLNFLDRAKEEEVIREYIFDTYLMSGNPYLFTNKVSQTAVFEIDGSNFLNIDRIELFTEGFPKQEEGHPADIFISNLSIVGVNQLSEQEMNGVSLSFVARKGYIFNNNSNESDEREVEAIVRVLGKTVNDTISQKLSFYWFVQNISISKSSPFYNKYGGYGWRCLNPYKVLERDEENNPVLIDFNPGKATFTVKKSDVLVKEQRYKCVVLYGDSSFEKQFIIINNDASYEINIKSDKGTEFVLDAGYPTLTCSVKKLNNQEDVTDNFIYRWGVINNKGNFSFLEETKDQYERKVLEEELYNNIEEGFNSNTLLKNGTDYVNPQFQFSVATNYDVYNLLKEKLQNYKTKQFIYKNIIYNVNIKKIINFSTYVCTVLDTYSNVIGSKEITLINKATSNGGYTLVINNGKQVFNYNEQGVSPCDNEKINFIIPQLTFSLYNQKGIEIDQNEIRNDNIKWIFPNKENTLLDARLMQDKQQIPQIDGTTIYPKIRIFSYGILKKYFINRDDNDIQLQVTYNGYTLSAKTNFLFTKEGFSGTNGTGLVLKIVSIDENNNQINQLPYLKINGNNNTLIFSNFNKLKAELWENGEEISSNNCVYVWSILKNYSNDVTNLSINQNGKNIISVNYNTLVVSDREKIPFNIIKVSVTYNERKIYATIPILIYQIFQSSYNLYLKENTGFQYVFYNNDGTNPQYDDRVPFTFILTQTSERTNGEEEDISDIVLQDFQHTYNYSINGNLFIKSQNGKQCTVIPNSIYDGSILNNILICEVTTLNFNNNVVARCVVPIHMMLNRYGHAALNDWDGNSIDVGNASGDTILAPQVGAGQKNNQNQFTGILMGTVKNGNDNKQNGLFGYSNGARTIFLDAKTGNANFGLAGKGQIQITAEKGQITGGDYSQENGTGLLIDLQKPEIRYGSGKFSVSSSGALTAKDEGSIAGWNIGTDKLNKDTVGMSSNNSSLDNIAFWAGNSDSSKAPFSVNFKGDLKATSINIGGDVFIKNGKIYTKDHQSFNSNGNGFYLAKDGLSIGANFSVNDKGSLIAKDGYIGDGTKGFKINSNSISNGNVYLGTDKISLGSTFSVNNAGYLKATSGKLAGWNFNANALYNDDVTNASYGQNQNSAYQKGIYFGPDGLRMGANFHVNKSGYLYAINGEFAGKITSSEGEIGGWKIKKTSLEGGKMSINSNGSMSGNGWSIGSDGKASFKNMNISGGTISGGSRTGGSISGGSISPSKVGVPGGGNLNDWCKDIVARSVTADYIESKVSDSGLSFTGWLNARKFSCSKEAYYKGSQIATQSWVRTELLKYAKKEDIPSSTSP